MNKMKWAYILSTPCVGKTTFINENEKKWKGWSLWDYDQLMPPRDWRIFKANKLPTKSIVMGVILPRYKEIDTSFIKYCGVILDRDVLKERIASRQAKNSNHMWAQLKNIEKNEKMLKEILKLYNLPIFNNFINALNYVQENIV